MAGSLARIHKFGIAATTALHVAASWALLHVDDVQSASASVPVMVSLIDSAGEKQVVAPPKAKPVTKSQPAPMPPAPSPQAYLPASPNPQVSQDAPSPESSITLPRFDADYLKNPPPTYPALARRLGEQGRVLLHVLVRADGTPADVTIRRSSGSTRLDQAALEAVRKWRFLPARQGDAPVTARVLVPISFTLEG